MPESDQKLSNGQKIENVFVYALILRQKAKKLFFLMFCDAAAEAHSCFSNIYCVLSSVAHPQCVCVSGSDPGGETDRDMIPYSP